MKTAGGRSVLLWIFWLGFVATGSGCAVDFRSFSIDSISRMPFMGFELKERKPKSSAPVYNSISRTEADNSRIEPALQTDSTPPRSILNLGIKNPFNSKLAANPPSGFQQTTQPKPSISIPLTFVEGAKSPIDRGSDASTIDFQ